MPERLRFEAYVNHQANAIYLAGLADIPESRPHSKISEAKGLGGPGLPKAELAGASRYYLWDDADSE